MSSTAPKRPQERPENNGGAVVSEELNDVNDSSSSGTSVVEPWCISVKTVGGGFDDSHGSSSLCSEGSPTGGERIFNVSVSPNDGLDSLHEVIEVATGLKPSQQRLIYRGRLIGSNDVDGDDDSAPSSSHTSSAIDGAMMTSSTAQPKIPSDSQQEQEQKQQSNRKIKDIVGLCDGQTIHLLRKRDVSEGNERHSTSPSSSSGRSTTLSGNAASTTLDEDLGSGGGALLAALLGLGSLAEENEDSSGGDASTATDGFRNSRTARLSASNARGTTASSWRSPPSAASTAGSSLFGRSHRRPHYRYSADDLRVPDPGSLESTRQGMMTLHTLLPHSQLHGEQGSSPLEANREWYRGQWCDVRDTVNQWLEATVVEILLPHEVLPEASTYQRYNVRRPPQVDTDPAIHANDLEGRRRLLIEACEPGDPEELGGDLVGFRPRRTNHGVQLLLIHYNGWPHRWDEWIRSDSERIRPFRTRTRHPDSSSTTSPTPQSIFTEAPRTNIRPGDDEEDRDALLPELYRVLTQVTSLLGDMVDQRQLGESRDERHRRVEANLPWLVPADDRDTAGIGGDDATPTMTSPCNIIEPIDTDEDDDDDNNAQEQADGSTPPPSGPRHNQRELRNLATLLDRLGRTLTDAAPHVASVAASIPDDNIASQTSRDGILGPDRTNTAEQDQSSTPLGGLLSLWSSSRERRRRTSVGSDVSVASPHSASRVDPDHVDYANGLVNTTRGEVRSGPRNRSASDDLATLLGTYLAAASLNSLANGDSDGGGNLGTLLRGSTTANGGGTAGRGEGGELAIHIQAVFTSPGATGGTGIATMGGVGGAGGGVGGAPMATAQFGGTRNLFSSVRGNRSSLLRGRASQSSSNAVSNEDDDSLFSDLYSENPTPIDPNTIGSPTTSSITRGNEGTRSSVIDPSAPDFMESLTQNTGQRRGSSRSIRRRQSHERRGSGLLRIFRRRGQNGENPN